MPATYADDLRDIAATLDRSGDLETAVQSAMAWVAVVAAENPLSRRPQIADDGSVVLIPARRNYK